MIFSLPTPNKLVFIAVLSSVLLGVGGGIYLKGVYDGKNKQAAAQAAMERESLFEGREVEKSVMKLRKNEVQKRLEVKWCRDCA